MSPLHDYIAGQVGIKLKEARIVVLYDEREEFRPFFDEACGGSQGILRTGAFGERHATVCIFGGSFLEVRSAIEPLTDGEDAADLVVYLPGLKRDEKTSLLLEVEKAGAVYQPTLKQLARIVLRKRFTDVAIDEMLASDQLSYADMSRMSEDSGGAEGASLLKSIFGGSDTRAAIVDWIARSAKDAEIELKGANGELRRALQARIGLEVAEGTALPKMRAVASRYVLGNEFRLGLRGPAPATLSSLPAPGTKDQEAAVRYVAAKLRETREAFSYENLADTVQSELSLSQSSVPGDQLGAVDTFRFEERAVVAKCFDLIAKDKTNEAAALLEGRGQSFWIESQQSRQFVWQACRLMLEMGTLADEVVATIAKANGKPEQWVERYVGESGWHRLDHMQRRLETLLAVIEDEEIGEAAIARCRARYDDVARRQAEGFSKVYEKAGWVIPGVLAQHRIWADAIANLPKPLAVVAVDAMRYEIGVELAERLSRNGEVKLRPAIAALPSITPIGMAAILPGAAAGFSIAEKNGKLGAKIGDVFMSDRSARQKYLQGQIAGIVDLTLDDVLTWSKATRTKVGAAQVVYVRSSEIDAAGEGGENRYARRIMEGTVNDVARCLIKLASVGIENAVITADHGHLYFGSEREDAMRISPPGGDTVDLHRRCWIGRGGTTPPGTVRISGPKLGYDTNLDVVVPTSVSVFKAGGDLAYHHGGASLQELVIPVISVRMKATTVADEKKALDVKLSTDTISNRIFLIEIGLGAGAGGFFAEPRRVRPIGVVSGRQVAVAKMTGAGAIENGEVLVGPSQTVTVGLILTDDEVQSLRIQVLDADTDAVLFESPKDVPVRLAM